MINVDTTSPHTFFVYGTLKQGGPNSHVWPHTPLSVIPACIPARLFDLGPYPAAISDSNSWTYGELWSFPTTSIPCILHALDELEGYQQPNSPDLYLREVHSAQPRHGSPIPAWVYYYANPQTLPPHRIIQPSVPFRHHLCAVWNPLATSTPD